MNQLFHISFSEPMTGHPGFQAFLKVPNTISLCSDSWQALEELMSITPQPPLPLEGSCDNWSRRQP